MIGSVEGNNSINAIRFFNATNAFKAQPTKQELAQNHSEEGTNIRENSILKNINVEEIKKYADLVGETNFNEEDIKYGLKFGRSVLINYSA